MVELEIRFLLGHVVHSIKLGQIDLRYWYFSGFDPPSLSIVLDSFYFIRQVDVFDIDNDGDDEDELINRGGPTEHRQNIFL